MMRNKSVTIIAGIILLIGGIGASFFIGSVEKKSGQPTSAGTQVLVNSSTTQEALTHRGCIRSGEYIDYPLNPRYDPIIKQPLLPLVVLIKDEVTQSIKFKFTIDNLIPGQSHPLEIKKCHVYAIRQWGFDAQRSKFLQDFHTELWRYSFDGNGEKVVALSERVDDYDSDSEILVYFSYDFRIDPLERYLVLEKSFLGKDDYALMIKDLETLSDVFAIKVSDLLEQNPGIKPGSFDLGVWTNDGKHLWGNLYDGPFETAWYRIEEGAWKVEVFPPPPDIQSGVERAWNFGGWIAYADLTSFTGDANITKQIEEEAANQGKQKHLWLYNFFTKQKTLIAAADPSWRFDINLSEIALTYHLPGQATSTYVLPR